MAKIITISQGSSSPETLSPASLPQRSRSSSTASTPRRDHLPVTVSDDENDIFECASSSRASSASASSSRSASRAPRPPSPVAFPATDNASGVEGDATPPRLSAADKGKGRAIDLPAASAAPGNVPEVVRPVAAPKSKLEELVDGLHEKLTDTWHAAVALFTYVVAALKALWGTVSQTASTGYQAAKGLWARARRSSVNFATAKLHQLQGYATADVEVPTGVYGRAKAAAKARVRGACAYLLNKLTAAGVPPTGDARAHGGVDVDSTTPRTPSEPQTAAVG